MDSTAPRPAEYYFYKNGQHNAWLEFTMTHERDQHRYLYVGFDKQWSTVMRVGEPDEAASYTELTEADLDLLVKKEKRYQTPLRHYLRVLDVLAWPTRARLLVFGPHELTVWEVKGLVVAEPKAPKGSEELWLWDKSYAYWNERCISGTESNQRLDQKRKILHKQGKRDGHMTSGAYEGLRSYCYHDDEYLDYLDAGVLDEGVKKRARGRFGPSAADHLEQHPPRRIRFLKVRRVGKRIKRESLFTSIDSLAVYRNLNSNTISPIRRIKGTDPVQESKGKQAGLPEKGWPISTKSMPKLGTQGKGSGEQELLYGQFIRLWLNSHTDLLESPSLRDWLKDLGSNEENQHTLALQVFNPILVETAAHMLLLDLGLFPDIGVGKGIDIVDLRGRIWPRPDLKNRKADPSEVIEKLAKLCPRRSLAELEEHLRNHEVLQIQCKAGGAKKSDRHRSILYFGHKLEKTRGKGKGATSTQEDGQGEPPRPTIDLGTLAAQGNLTKEDFPMLYEFIRMQADVLLRPARH